MDLVVGQRATRALKVEPALIETYGQITGDRNPLHFDAEFARRTRFKRLIAQGGITTGLLHALVAMDMPGPGSVFVRQNWSFPAPVYIGDELRAEATVRSLRPARRLAELSFEVRNQDDIVVLQGDALVFQDSGGV